jgi:hypothetical protein
VVTPLEVKDEARAHPPDVSPPVEDIEPAGALDAAFRAARERQDDRYRAVMRGANATAAALDHWEGVRSAEEWEKARERAPEAFASGRFLLERLGAERELDPALMATLLHLRERLRQEYAVQGASEEMLLDMALVAFHDFLRVQSWVGNAALLIEHQLFGQPAPTVRVAGKPGRGGITGLQVEEEITRLTGALLPALDRLTRQLIRCLRAIRDLRGGPLPLSVGQVGQLNVGAVQQNTAEPAARATSAIVAR